MLIILLAILLVLCPSLVAADWLQYRLKDGQVTGYNTTGIGPVPGHRVVETPPVTWPIPVGGCAEGRPEWTLVTAPAPLTLVVNPAIALFRCRQVGDGAQVDAIVAEEMSAIEARTRPPGGQAEEVLIGRIDEACANDKTPHCQAANAAKDRVKGKGPPRAKEEVRALAEEMEALVNEAEAVKASLGP
jgi:hypothetical protein